MDTVTHTGAQPPAVWPFGRENPRRDEVLSAALELFTSRGYFNTSVQDIQKAAGVSTGFIYHHFSSKEELARALYHKLIDGLAADIAAIGRDHSTLAGRSRALIGYFLRLAEERPAAMAFILHARHREFMPDEKPICSSAPFAMMLDMVREGTEKGEAREVETVVAATALFGGCIRMIHLFLDGVIEPPLTPMADDVWRCAWEGVRAGDME